MTSVIQDNHGTNKVVPVPDAAIWTFILSDQLIQLDLCPQKVSDINLIKSVLGQMGISYKEINNSLFIDAEHLEVLQHTFNIEIIKN